MNIIFSIPIVCYLKNFLDVEKRKSSAYWVSNIYSETNDFIGYREVFFESDCVREKTYDSKKNQISDAFIRKSGIVSGSIDMRIYFDNCEISKYYYPLDVGILECLTNQVGKNILSGETLTASDGKTFNGDWINIFSHTAWYCFLKDSEHNQIGYREIEVNDNSSYIKTIFDNKKNSQYEFLNKIDPKIISEHGSLDRYIDYCKLIHYNKSSKVSLGGILLDSNLDIEYHKNEAKK